MSKKKGKTPPPRRKQRTRQHVIADLSANHVERHVLLCGFSTERVVHDYGIDLILFTYDQAGQTENGQVLLQLKATDDFRTLKGKKVTSFSVSSSDLKLWLAEPMPVILVVYNPKADLAYWLYVQAYFEEMAGFNLDGIGESVQVHVPLSNVLNRAAIRRFSEFRDAVLMQFKGVVQHHA